jgi:hypothetical protein
MKLSKTEAQLIELARQRDGMYSIETGSGRGSFGGRIQYGVRERNALFKLVERGLAVITYRDTWQDYNRGYGQGGSILTFQLTTPGVK